MKRPVITDGKSAFFLDQYPEQAWTSLAPKDSEFGDARQNIKVAANYYNTVAFLYR